MSKVVISYELKVRSQYLICYILKYIVPTIKKLLPLFSDYYFISLFFITLN